MIHDTAYSAALSHLEAVPCLFGSCSLPIKTLALWGLPNDLSIFTEHVEAQFSWIGGPRPSGSGDQIPSRLKPSNKPAFPGSTPAKPDFPGATVSAPTRRYSNSTQAAEILNLFKEYPTFKGRASRKKFWLFILFNFIAANVLGLVSSLVAARTGHVEIGFAGPVLYYLCVLIPTLAVTVHRFHDTSRSAWWLLITLVPVLGAVALVALLPNKTNPELVGAISGVLGAIALVVLLTLKGEKGGNRYGAKPTVATRPAQTAQALARKNRRIVIAAALVLCAVVGVIVGLRQTSQGGKQASGLAPLGPIVQVPPHVRFRGPTRSVDESSNSPFPSGYCSG